MNLENWIRNKLQEHEEMQDYSLATETVRCWIDEYNDQEQQALKKQLPYDFIHENLWGAQNRQNKDTGNELW